jgi:hypothetical protein
MAINKCHNESKKGKPTWNKGLTMEDPRVKAGIERLNASHPQQLSEETKQKISKALANREVSLSHRKALSLAAKGKAKSSEAVAKMTATKNAPEQRLAQSERSRILWENSDYIKKVYDGLGRRPTKPEERLMNIFSKYFPELQYNGDFRLGVSLRRLIPDFINVNGAKEVVEVFGERFHKASQVDEKIARYKQLGYNCLILWSKDVMRREEADIVTRIELFRGENK